MSFFEDLKYELNRHSKLTLLIAANIIVFFLINISSGIFNSDFVALNLALPLDIHNFFLKFWTIFTYMFSHKDFGHVFYNMLLLYFTSHTFLNFLSERKLIYVYIMSGLSGGVLLLLLSSLFPAVFNHSILFGASAAVLGLVTCLAMYIPNLSISLFGFIEMRYKYFALLIFGLSTIIDFNINTGGKISHFGGVFFGLFFGFLLKNGKDISVINIFKKQKKQPLKIVHSNKSAKTPLKNNSTQQTIDHLLDKISKNGYENLSKEEKELLFKLSKEK